MTAPEKHPVRISRYFYEFLKFECELINPHVAEDYPDRQLAIEESIELGVQYPTVPAALRETKRHIWIDANDEHTPFFREEARKWCRDHLVGTVSKTHHEAHMESQEFHALGEGGYDDSPESYAKWSGVRRSAEATYKVLGRTP